MTEFLSKLKELDNFTETENGAVALRSTGSKLLDAFGTLGSMKDSSEEDIISTFSKAFNEEPELSMRLLFYIRDIRGGQGMRRVFRIIVKWLAEKHPTLVLNNLDNFLFFGRGDDVVCLLDNETIKMDVIEWINDVLENDLETLDDANAYPTLLAKWLPSENTSSKETKRYARIIIEGLNWTPKHYRKVLSKLRAKIGIVETLMSQNKWEQINFEKLPSKAAMIYSDAFMKHVKDNYISYLKALANGDAKVNAGALFPVDIAHKVFDKWGNCSLKDQYLLDAMWKALPNYFEGTEETGMCVVDTSGSMMGTPMEVAYSLGMYCADKAKGPFKNHFITFSENPRLQEITGDTIVEKFMSMNLGLCENTNIEKVFNLILRTAKSNNLKQEDLPSKLYIISDMQWDNCVYDSTCKSGWFYEYNLKPETFISTMRKKYAENGYDLPAIVYWNVSHSDCGMFQQGKDEDSCCMVSGYSPSLFRSVIEGTEFEQTEVIDEVTGETKVVTKQKIDPITVMLNTLNNERYDCVVVNA